MSVPGGSCSTRVDACRDLVMHRFSWLVCRFWDYTTGYGFQNEVTRVQPGSLDAEAGIYAMAFDQTGTYVGVGVRP